MLGQSISRNAFLLGLFAVATALLLAGSYLLTKDRITEAVRKAEEKALLEIVPRARMVTAAISTSSWESIATAP